MEKKGSVKREFSREDDLIIDKVPKEQSSNIMNIREKVVWRPNNYRRQMKISIYKDITLKKIKSDIPKRNLKISDHTKLIFIKNYMNCTLRIGKNTLTAMLSQNIDSGKKEHYILEGTSNWIQDRIKLEKKKIEDHLDKVLKTFSKRYNLYIPFVKIEWTRQEDWIKGDKFIIDKFKKDAVFYEQDFKKVYKSGVEFLGKKNKPDTKQLINHLKNSALNNLQGDLVVSINNLVDIIGIRKSPLKWLKNNFKDKNDLFNIDCREAISNLSASEKIEFLEFFFEKFGNQNG